MFMSVCGCIDTYVHSKARIQYQGLSWLLSDLLFERFTCSWRTWSSPIGKTGRLWNSKGLPVSSSPGMRLQVWPGDATKVSRFSR